MIYKQITTGTDERIQLGVKVLIIKQGTHAVVHRPLFKDDLHIGWKVKKHWEDRNTIDFLFSELKYHENYKNIVPLIKDSVYCDKLVNHMTNTDYEEFKRQMDYKNTRVDIFYLQNDITGIYNGNFYLSTFKILVRDLIFAKVRYIDLYKGEQETLSYLNDKELHETVLYYINDVYGDRL